MSHQPPKIIIAAGGTGGHLFPAQALAEQLLVEKKDIELFFAGAKLSESAYFDRTKFRFRDIVSTTPFRGNFYQALKSIGTLFKGVFDSLQWLSAQKPDLVVGFGSFHAFPILCAAAIKNIPLILFESNAIPGKVIRLFSQKALITAHYFPGMKKYLKGKTIEVDIPQRESFSRHRIPKEEARHILQLDQNLSTLLVFGGSQGAKAINEKILQMLPTLKSSIQLIHFTGNDEMAREVSALCQKLSIKSYVKKFESQMDLAWSAADMVICRSGAMTVSELLHYEVPGILIPYPYAADQHQLENAQFLEKTVGGAIHFLEVTLTPSILADAIDSMQRQRMREAIKEFKTQQKKADLVSLIMQHLETCK